MNHIEHFYNNLRLKFLQVIREIIERFKIVEDLATREEVKNAIVVFAQLLSNILIRRNENSRWFDKRLLELVALYCLLSNSKFLEEYLSKYTQITTNWEKTRLDELKANQVTWNAHENNRNYLKRHFERSIFLARSSTFSISSKSFAFVSTLVSHYRRFSTWNRNTMNERWCWEDLHEDWYESIANEVLFDRHISRALNELLKAQSNSRQFCASTHVDLDYVDLFWHDVDVRTSKSISCFNFNVFE